MHRAGRCKVDDRFKTPPEEEGGAPGVRNKEDKKNRSKYALGVYIFLSRYICSFWRIKRELSSCANLLNERGIYESWI